MRTLALAMALTLPAALWASPTAMLTGRVTDITGVVMQGVEVQAINVENGVKISTETNDEGLYRLPQLQPGTYRILLQKHGFRTIVKPGVELRVEDIFALNFEMEIGSLAESITVQEGAPLIQAETGTLSQTIDRNVMAELPTLTRNPYDFVALSAGAVPALNARKKMSGFCAVFRWTVQKGLTDEASAQPCESSVRHSLKKEQNEGESK
jgi:Carboxypeptidase regulatory-like domain